ncbi:MAG: heavy-metal-associated domain-containing protein [Gemmatimonadales bacterium]|nr:heavy-metal-associated domain-containing protein [Gemmatimonadales bacterium]
MSCGHCINAVNQALGTVPGVQIDAVRIGSADVRYDEDSISPAQIQAAVTGAGFKATAA